MKTIILTTLLICMVLLGVGHSARQGSLTLGLSLSMGPGGGGGWMNNWFNPRVF